MDGGGAVATVDVGDSNGLRARFGKCEPAHGHGQALRTDERIDLHRVRVMHRHIRRHDTVTTVLVLKCLHVFARLGVGFSVPEKGVAYRGVESGFVGGVHRQGQGDDAVAALLVDKLLGVSARLGVRLVVPCVRVAHGGRNLLLMCLVNIQGHRHYRVAAFHSLQCHRLRTRRTERQPVPFNRQQVFAKGAVLASHSGMQNSHVQVKYAVTTVLVLIIHGIVPRFHIVKAIPHQFIANSGIHGMMLRWKDGQV